MPFIKLGNIKPDLDIVDNLESIEVNKALSANQGTLLKVALDNQMTNGAGLYQHTYDEINLIHNFVGHSKFGYCKCTNRFHDGDIIQVNGSPIRVTINKELIKNDVNIIFVIDNNAMLIFNKAEALYIPDGTLETNLNDLSTWFACAGLNWETYGSPSLDTIVTNKDLCMELMSSENAREYYQRSSELIVGSITNQNIIDALDAQNPFTSAYMSSISSPNDYTCSNNGYYTSDLNNYNQWGAWASTETGKMWLAANSNTSAGYYNEINLPIAIWPYKIIGQTGNYGSNQVNTKYAWQVYDLETQVWITLQDSYGTSTSALFPRYNLAGYTKKSNQFRLYCTSKNGVNTHASAHQNRIWGFQ